MCPQKHNVKQELTADEMTILDINSEYRGVPRTQLMLNAGKSVADEIVKIMKKNKITKPKIAFFCHTGGNGGDGFVAANLLSKKANVDVFFTGTESSIKSKPGLANYKILNKNAKVVIKSAITAKDIAKIDLLSYDIVVDALLGTGLTHKKLREPISSAIKKINTFNKVIISIDVPSGLLKNGQQADNIIQPTYTISLHKPKLGTYTFGGKVIKVDIGIPKETPLYTGPGHFSMLPMREKNFHKGQYGKLLIIAGSKTYHGAPILAAKAALAINIDLVTLVVPNSIITAVRSHDFRFIVHGYEEGWLTKKTVDNIIKPLLSKVDAVLVGPGLGTEEETIEAVKYLISKLPSTIGLVIDADGLKAINKELILQTKCVLTPHSGEFKQITNQILNSTLKPEEKLKIAQKSIQAFCSKIVWLLKGQTDIIMTTEKHIFNDTGIPELTVGGTGDILAGLTSGFLCLVDDPFIAATLSSFLIGIASEIQLNEKNWFNLELMFDYLIKSMVEIRKFIKEEENLISNLLL
jgi:NAD(P)H-hydrate epimerase